MQVTGLVPIAKTAAGDLLDGFCEPRIWGRLGWLEIKRRYRRTVIGPFWTSISVLIFVMSLGLVGASLWKLELRVFLPYLASGVLAWVMISTTLIEACSLFYTSSLFRNIRFDFSILIYALIWRNFIVFLHHAAVYAVIILVLAPGSITLFTLLTIPSLLVLMINGVWASLVLAIICHRFRDVPQIISSLFQIAMFITPIFWAADQLDDAQRTVFVDYNPLYHYVQLLRWPLLGKCPEARTCWLVGSLTVFGWLFALRFFKLFRKRIAYWS